MKHLLLALSLLFVGGCTEPTNSVQGQQTQVQVDVPNGHLLYGKVINIIDGDTVTIKDANGEEHRIRLGEIDAPEKSQAFGKESATELKDLVMDKQVKVFWKKKDSFTWKTTDHQERRGRIIGGIYISDRFINRELVERGAAWHYKEFSKDDTLAQAEAYAKKNKYGLWAAENPTPPWEYRKKKK